MKTAVPKTGIMPRVKRDLTFAEGRLDTVNFQVVDMRVFARATVQRSTVVDANVAAHIFERCCVFNLRQCILHTLFAYFLSLFHRSFSPPLRLNSPTTVTRSMQNMHFNSQHRNLYTASGRRQRSSAGTTRVRPSVRRSQGRIKRKVKGVVKSINKFDEANAPNIS